LKLSSYTSNERMSPKKSSEKGNVANFLLLIFFLKVEFKKIILYRSKPRLSIIFILPNEIFPRKELNPLLARYKKAEFSRFLELKTKGNVKRNTLSEINVSNS